MIHLYFRPQCEPGELHETGGYPGWGEGLLLHPVPQAGPAEAPHPRAY